MYIDYLKNEVKKHAVQPTPKQIAYFEEFRQNLLDGMDYYYQLFPQMIKETSEYRQRALDELAEFKKKLENFINTHNAIFGSFHPRLIHATV